MKAVSLMTDICSLIRSIRTVLLSITVPAFRDAGHMVLTHKLLGTASSGFFNGSGWDRELQDEEESEGKQSDRQHVRPAGCHCRWNRGHGASKPPRSLLTPGRRDAGPAAKRERGEREEDGGCTDTKEVKQRRRR